MQQFKSILHSVSSQILSCICGAVAHAFLGTYHCREWCPTVNLHSWGFSETASSFSGVWDFCSMTPVTAHPFCEVTVVVFIVIHNESRQKSERHDGNVQGASAASFLQVVKVCSQMSDTERNNDVGWPTESLTDWLLYYTTTSHKVTFTCCCSIHGSKNMLHSLFCSSL